ncbi:hypothetical protein Q9233_003615 [Columba guinea]|nr:hypothetical protein Q9233_003615 [Columba guinea]
MPHGLYSAIFRLGALRLTVVVILTAISIFGESVGRQDLTVECGTLSLTGEIKSCQVCFGLRFFVVVIDKSTELDEYQRAFLSQRGSLTFAGQVFASAEHGALLGKPKDKVAQEDGKTCSMTRNAHWDGDQPDHTGIAARLPSLPSLSLPPRLSAAHRSLR